MIWKIRSSGGCGSKWSTPNSWEMRKKGYYIK